MANFVVIFRENSLEIDQLIRPAFLTFFKQRSSLKEQILLFQQKYAPEMNQ